MTKLFGLDLLRESYGPPKPLTADDFLRAIEHANKVMSQPPPEPIRLVSYARYKAAEEAIAAGATPREVEWILLGATLEQAKELCK